MTKKIPDINDINPTKASKEFADKEAESFSEAALEKKAKTNDHKRKECLRTIFHLGNIGIILCLYGAIIIGIFVLTFHWIFPEKWGFLIHAQLETIKTILFSA